MAAVASDNACSTGLYILGEKEQGDLGAMPFKIDNFFPALCNWL